jgi:hypothetical protein
LLEASKLAFDEEIKEFKNAIKRMKD